MGEKGIEVQARNSHSMSILSNVTEKSRILVIYGGASPEKGTLAETIYAYLPFDPSTIGLNDLFGFSIILYSLDARYQELFR